MVNSMKGCCALDMSIEFVTPRGAVAPSMESVCVETFFMILSKGSRHVMSKSMYIPPNLCKMKYLAASTRCMGYG